MFSKILFFVQVSQNRGKSTPAPPQKKLELFEPVVEVVKPLHSVFEPVIVLDVGDQKGKKQQIQAKNGNLGNCGKKEDAADTEDGKENHHEFMNQALVLKKRDVRTHRQQLLRGQRAVLACHRGKDLLVIAQFLQHKAPPEGSLVNIPKKYLF